MKLHDPELRMIAEQLARLEDRLGAGTGPVVESPGNAILELLRVVRTLTERLDELSRRQRRSVQSAEAKTAARAGGAARSEVG